MSDNWTQYFEHINTVIDDKSVDRYVYNDKGVITLPDNLPMPPTDTFHCMFPNCSYLQDITVLSKWGVSNVKDTQQMFAVCTRLQNITALANWNVSNVENMYGMFSNCHQLNDITALTNWNVSNVKDMRYMFYECHELQIITNKTKGIKTYLRTLRKHIYQ